LIINVTVNYQINLDNKINTTKLGDQFEAKSLDIIMKVIEDGQLAHLADHVKIFQKKEYYSSLRKKNIKFDLTIEVWPPGANRYVLIYIIECKDYDKRVPVSKIEDFHSKILQVAGVNVKGIFITNSPLQEGGYNIAESVGMMVIQGESSNDYKIVLHKANREEKINKLPFIIETIDRGVVDIGVNYIENLIDKEIINVFELISDNSRISYNLGKLSKETIEEFANAELNKIDSKILSSAYTLTAEKLIKYLDSEYGIKIVDFDDKTDLLGSCDIKNNIIRISRSLQGTDRELFIIAHEFGHYLLHQKLSIGQFTYDFFEDSPYSLKTGKHDLKNPRHWIEWQANYFAASLVLPKVSLLVRLSQTQRFFNKSLGKICLNDQYENIKDFSKLIKSLSTQFSTSKTSIIYRLKEFELINDQSRLKSIRQIVTEYYDDLFA